jgi:hypothetical protein
MLAQCAQALEHQYCWTALHTQITVVWMTCHCLNRLNIICSSVQAQHRLQWWLHVMPLHHVHSCGIVQCKPCCLLLFVPSYDHLVVSQAFKGTRYRDGIMICRGPTILKVTFTCWYALSNITLLTSVLCFASYMQMHTCHLLLASSVLHGFTCESCLTLAISTL